MLTVYLLLMRDKPEWAPYLSMLPTEVGLPVSYTAEELKQLKGSSSLLQLVPLLRSASSDPGCR